MCGPCRSTATTRRPPGRPAIVAAADGADAIVAAGSDRGNELLAHVAALLDQPFAANVTAVDGDVVTRIRWGGSLLEEARLHGSPKILYRRAAHAAPRRRPCRSRRSPRPTPTARRASLETVAESSGGVSLRDAKVVVSGGRGVGSAEGFAIIEELAGLLGAAVGCSRVVTSAGWRPHTDQVGQTGTKISRRPVRRVRDQRRDAAHRRREGREEDPRDQRRPGGADLRERRLRGDRRPARDRPGDQRRAAEGAAHRRCVLGALLLVVGSSTWLAARSSSSDRFAARSRTTVRRTCRRG